MKSISFRSALAAFAWHMDWNPANVYLVRMIRRQRLVNSAADFLVKINRACMLSRIILINFFIQSDSIDYIMSKID